MAEVNGSSKANETRADFVSRPSSSDARYAFARQILSPSVFSRIQSSQVLVVGAGGIGCEVLKDLVCSGFGNITIIDLDTIDLSNLNRQFLFNKSHIKKSKSLIASSIASNFNPNVNIKAYHANIKESQFNFDFFKSFDVVLNALDNLDARRWVNKMCIAANVPLVESGTTGFLGQVQPIVKDLTACYDCTNKVTPKTYPVCTIRSTPSTPIHCVVWAKTWLFTQLFGEDDETEALELDKAEADGGNSQEINALRSEAQEMANLRKSLASDGAAQRVFDKIFKNDVERLLRMEGMWATRAKPEPIAYAEASQTPHEAKKQGLKDQLQLGLRETTEMFEKSLQALASRSAKNPTEPLNFDKDDDDALDFVTAASNLRSRIYNIDLKTRFDVKQMAGNIIPAIASTNAIISGAQVLQAIHMLTGKYSKTRDIALGRASRFVLTGSATGQQNPECGVCVDQYIPIRLDPVKVTLGEIVETAKLPREEGGLGIDEEVELGVYEGSRLLADEDFQDNYSKSLSDLGISVGSFVTLVDEDGVKRTIQLSICPSSQDSTKKITLPPKDQLPTFLDRPAKKKSSEETDDEEDKVLPVENGTAAAEEFSIDENPDLSRFNHNKKRVADENGSNEKKRRIDDDDKEEGDESSASEVKKRRVQEVDSNPVIELD
ncbi:unnamed protein product [Sympodiomycopsis kandeliae]